jgi:uncharacterized membrane protein/protein-disulfide isomerase
MPGPVWRWGLRLTLGIALAASAYLAWTSLAGGTLVGCSGLPQFDCDQALSGRWARWFSIPVSIPGFLVYAAMLLAAACVGPKRPPIVLRSAWLTLVYGAILATCAAVWFLGLAVFVEKKFCPWCLAAHASALVSSGLVLLAFQRSAGSAKQQIPLVQLGMPAAAALGALILGQWLGPAPQSNRVETLSDAARSAFAAAESTPAGSSGPHASNKLAEVAAQRPAASPPSYPEYPDDVPLPPGVFAYPKADRSAMPARGSLDLQANPYLGEPGARFVMVELFDYTCHHCREAYHHLELAEKRYGSQFAVVVLPVPLNKDCNEYVQVTRPEHVDACRYARLAIAVWKADARKFPEFHRWLFEPDRPPAMAVATSHAAELVGAAALAAAERGPQVEQMLARNLRLYHLLGADVLPKLVIGNYVSTGRVQSPELVFSLLEGYMGIRPAP